MNLANDTKINMYLLAIIKVNLIDKKINNRRNKTYVKQKAKPVQERCDQLGKGKFRETSQLMVELVEQIC